MSADNGCLLHEKLGYPLHEKLQMTKRTRLKRGRPWLGRVEDVVQCISALEDITLGVEWTVVPMISVHIFTSSSRLIEPLLKKNSCPSYFISAGRHYNLHG